MKQTKPKKRSSRALYRIGKSGIQGRGVFAAQRLRAGQKIIEYTGEIIPNDEADRRYDETNMTRHHTFLFCLDDDRCVDGDDKKNDARLINHSCDPNCEVFIEDEHIWIYAMKNIQPGVELAYDYAYERSEPKKMEKFYVCHCGATKCRGSIMAPAKKRKKKKAAR
ncbi:MAG: SET domain-containing protein-lysine N-methyltransferase [Gemmatimonadaceae bacterium]